MKAIGTRYVKDIRSYAKAFLVALVGILPLTLQGFGVYALFVYLFLLVFGALNILVFGLLAAMLQNYIYKLMVFLVAIAANATLLARSIGSIDGFNLTVAVFAQVVFLFGLSYVWVERARIGARWKSWLTFE